MKNLLLLLCCFSVTSFAEHVTCYSGGKIFYEGEFKEILPSPGYVAVKKDKSIDLVSGDCILTFNDKPTHRKKAHK